MKYMFALVLVAMLIGCSGTSEYELLKTEKGISTQEVTSRSIEYVILPQDRLDVTLFKEPGQMTDALGGSGALGQSIKEKGLLVNANGDISLPLIERIHVAGLSQSKAANKINAEYKKHLNSPSVYVEVLNKRIFVLGEVNKQGTVNLDREKMTLFEALALSGGLTDSAVRDEILIVSNSSNGMLIRKVDLTNFDMMRYAALMLRPNDIVYVQPNGWKQFRVASDDLTSPFKSLGAILTPFANIKYLAD